MKERSDYLSLNIVDGSEETATPGAEASLLVDLYRQLELAAVADTVLLAKKSRKGLRPGQMVESFVLLSVRWTRLFGQVRG